MSSISESLKYSVENNKVVQELYLLYAKKLVAYTLKNYALSEDDCWNLTYKTIFKISTLDGYTFVDEKQKAAFIFRTHINFLKNFFRDEKRFEQRNLETAFTDQLTIEESVEPAIDPALILLKKELDQLEEWQRILVLLRAQDLPYSEIARFVDKPEKQLKVYYGRLKVLLMNKIADSLKKNIDEKK